MTASWWVKNHEKSLETPLRGDGSQSVQVIESQAFADKLMSMNGRNILDFGCGSGRLTGLLAHGNEVIGCDVSMRRIMRAADRHHNIQFYSIDPEQDDFEFIPPKWRAEEWTLFAHTVFLHMPAPLIKYMLHKAQPDRIIVSEIMDPALSHPTGDPPTWCRSPIQYLGILKPYLIMELKRFRYNAYHPQPGHYLTWVEMERAYNPMKMEND